jgi:hypothetical protein
MTGNKRTGVDEGMKRLRPDQYVSTAVEARMMAFVASRWGRWKPRRYLHIAIAFYVLAVVWLAGGVLLILNGL